MDQVLLSTAQQQPLRLVMVCFALLFALFVRSIVSHGPHSGLGAPPMHGDFEAQRHWMGITMHLPVEVRRKTTTSAQR